MAKAKKVVKKNTVTKKKAAPKKKTAKAKPLKLGTAGSRGG